MKHRKSRVSFRSVFPESKALGAWLAEKNKRNSQAVSSNFHQFITNIMLSVELNEFKYYPI